SHQFLVETLQGGTVILVAIAALRTDRGSRVGASARLSIAVCLGVLTKASNILFLAPLIAVGSWRIMLAGKPGKPVAAIDIVATVFAGVVVVATIAWYVTNWADMAEHVRVATSGDVALRYGSPVEPLRKLSYWLYSLAKAISPFLAIAVVIAAL